jgi:hypothetical protein
MNHFKQIKITSTPDYKMLSFKLSIKAFFLLVSSQLTPPRYMPSSHCDRSFSLKFEPEDNFRSDKSLVVILIQAQSLTSFFIAELVQS